MSCSSNRLKEIQSKLKSESCRFMYVRNTSDIHWLTGFDHVFDDEQAHAMLIPAKGKTACLRTDSRYVAACERAALSDATCEDPRSGEGASASGIPAVSDATDSGVSDPASSTSSCPAVNIDISIGKDPREKWARKLISKTCPKKSGSKSSCKHFDKCKKCSISGISVAIEDTISLREYRALKKQMAKLPKSKLVETHDLILGLRAVKDADEIRRIKDAQNITDEAFSKIIEHIKPGITEKELQHKLDDLLFMCGADELAFPTIVACGENGASPHAQPGGTILEEGMCVVMDFGAKLNGYCSDMTRTVFLGKPQGKMLKAWETMRRANEAAEAAIRKDVIAKDVHDLAEQILTDGGFAHMMGHALGHGVGIDIHELPTLSPRNAEPLKVGNVVTVEPGIYIPGEFGMRLEDMGVVTEDGFEVFTKSTHEMIVV